MKHTFLLALVCILLACQKKDAAVQLVIPEGIIQRDAMKEVLKDIHKVEVLSRDKHLSVDTNFTQSSVGWYYDDVYRKHGITEQQFQGSFDFYSKHFKYFMGMYDELIKEMQEEEKVLKEEDKKIREEKRLKDQPPPKKAEK